MLFLLTKVTWRNFCMTRRPSKCDLFDMLRRFWSLLVFCWERRCDGSPVWGVGTRASRRWLHGLAQSWWRQTDHQSFGFTAYFTSCLCLASRRPRQAAAASDKWRPDSSTDPRTSQLVRAAESRTNFRQEVELHDTQLEDHRMCKTGLNLNQDSANQVPSFITKPNGCATRFKVFILLNPDDEKGLLRPEPLLIDWTYIHGSHQVL